MSLLLDNKVLAAAEAKLESQLTPETREAYERIVTAGLRVVLSGGVNGILASLKDSRDPITDSAKGAVNTVLALSRESRGTMPPNAMVPAAMTLMLKALDTVNRAKIKKIGANDLDKATRIFANYVFNVFKITPQKFQTVAGRVHGIMQDPTKMEMINRHSGVMKDPRTSTPTNLPLAVAPRKGLINGV